MKRISTIALFCLLSFAGFAQQEPVAMADELRADGTIYWIIASICVVFLLIVALLVATDLRISKLEQEAERTKEQA